MTDSETVNGSLPEDDPEQVEHRPEQYSNFDSRISESEEGEEDEEDEESSRTFYYPLNSLPALVFEFHYASKGKYLSLIVIHPIILRTPHRSRSHSPRSRCSTQAIQQKEG